mmetsp:Transcript_6043/g.14971  ORF Transcript_6043/g.14971 Transcript_6043/m.14971 type:complete len:213 (-) Transcript_6043:403-1041(-)
MPKTKTSAHPRRIGNTSRKWRTSWPSTSGSGRPRPRVCVDRRVRRDRRRAGDHRTATRRGRPPRRRRGSSTTCPQRRKLPRRTRRRRRPFRPSRPAAWTWRSCWKSGTRGTTPSSIGSTNPTWCRAAGTGGRRRAAAGIPPVTTTARTRRPDGSEAATAKAGSASTRAVPSRRTSVGWFPPGTGTGGPGRSDRRSRCPPSGGSCGASSDPVT